MADDAGAADGSHCACALRLLRSLFHPKWQPQFATI